MPLLHLVLTENDQEITLDSELVAQNLVLISASCSYNSHSGSVREAVAVDFPFVSPLDYISSDSSRHIVLPFDFGKAHEGSNPVSSDYLTLNFPFQTEHIPRTFTVKTFAIDKGASATFTQPSDLFGSSNHNLLRIDLYFHYESLDRTL